MNLCARRIRSSGMLVVGGLLSLLAIGDGVSVYAQSPPPPRLTNLQTTTAGWELQWEFSGTNSAFTVQYEDTLRDGLWRVPLAPYPVPGSAREWLDLSGTNSSRFYRLLAVQPPVRGEVLSSQLASTISTGELQLLFTLVGVPLQPVYSVRVYRLVYETISPLGAPTTASGVLCVPVERTGALPLVSYQHGTITQTNKAPSSLDPTTEVSVGIAFATSGYAAVVADYLGLGDSPGLHPYHHARSEATACVDLMRAAFNYAATNAITLTNRVFLCGYSQGGHATMALLRELELFHPNEFHVIACAPMAGAYDISGVTASDFLSARPKPNPYYFLYLLAAYQEVYHFAPSLSDLLAPPYNTSLPALLRANPTGGQLNAAMPDNALQILRPEYLEEFLANPRHPLRLALEDNDVYRWKPVAPLRFYHCSGDQDVPVANTQTAVSFLHSIGRTDVDWIDPLPNADHTECAIPSMLDAKLWFDSLR